MCRVVLIALVVGWAGVGSAQTGDPEENEIRLGDLIRQALERNPEVLRAEERVRAMRARVPQAGALADPMLLSGVINEGRAVPFDSLGEAEFSEVYVGISQEIPYAGKRGLREDVARGEASAERWAYEATRRKVALEVAEVYFDLHAALAARGTVERNLELMDRLSAVALERLSVGHGVQQDVLAAELELSRLEEQRSLFEQEQALLEASLARLLDRSAPLSGRRLQPLSRTSIEEVGEGGVERAEKASPELQEQLARAEAAERRVALARKERLPDFGVELVYHDRGKRDLDPFYGIGTTVTLPVYRSRKQEKAIEEASAELRAARSSGNAARADLRFAWTRAQLQAKTSDRLLRLYDEGLLAQSRLMLDSSIAQYRVGRVDFAAVIASWRSLLEGEIAYLRQLAAHEKAITQIALYEGSPAVLPDAPLGEDRP
jgi:outer membrane protein, heavy metal efflux system